MCWLSEGGGGDGSSGSGSGGGVYDDVFRACHQYLPFVSMVSSLCIEVTR